ncbi:hypothetical protein [Haliangium sp.]|uniref:hypothetical protein n=1 Tax=Haliangium sp. TaxID=2663208 RepID=UPI003D09E56E
MTDVTEPGCEHAERRDGVCARCGHCLHELILNGACYYCGSTELDGVALSPKPTPALVPVDRLLRRKP